MAKKKTSKKITQLTWGGKFYTLLQILIFKPKPALEKIANRGKKFLPMAGVIVFLFASLSFLGGFDLSSFVGFFESLASTFIYVGLIYFLGKLIFKGKADFWNLFSSLTCIDIILLYLIPIFILLIFTWGSAIALVAIWVLYYLFLSVLAVNLCHKINGAQSFVVVLISAIILVLLNYGLSVLLKLPGEGVVGQAIGFMV